jgi:predicted metal-dependent enzyme (double-stranded beta helix superfamily)
MTATPLDRLAPLRDFVTAMTALVDSTRDETRLLAEGRRHLAALIADDAWLPDEFAVPNAERYMQYLLHCDPLERFCVVSFVWQPGHRTPVHDHTVWGLVGQLRGAERCEEYPLVDGRPQASGGNHVMHPGDIDAVSPAIGDWHRVSNASPDCTAVSIHVYGANIGATRRHRLDEHGAVHEFVSGYDSPFVPNLWDKAAAIRTAARAC